MTNEVGFRLPPAEIRRVYLRAMPWVAVSLVAYPFVAGSGDARLIAETAILVAVVFAGANWLTKIHKWVRLSSAGMSGSSLRGAKVVIPWSAQVSIRRTSYSGSAGVTVGPEPKSPSLFLPLSIATSPQFKAKLRELARPITHCTASAKMRSNPSIEGMHKKLRPLCTPDVKR